MHISRGKHCRGHDWARLPLSGQRLLLPSHVTFRSPSKDTLRNREAINCEEKIDFISETIQWLPRDVLWTSEHVGGLVSYGVRSLADDLGPRSGCFTREHMETRLSASRNPPLCGSLSSHLESTPARILSKDTRQMHMYLLVAEPRHYFLSPAPSHTMLE